MCVQHEFLIFQILLWQFLVEQVTDLCHLSQAVWSKTKQGYIICYSQTSCKKKSRGSEDQIILYKYLLPFSIGSFTFQFYIQKPINANSENYNLKWVSNMVFHSKEKTQIKGLWEWRAKMTYGLEEKEKVTILRRLKICTLHLTLCRLLNQVWQNNKLDQDRLKWWTVNTVTNLQVTYNEWMWLATTSQRIQNITE
jgi:hypothetical protein